MTTPTLSAPRWLRWLAWLPLVMVVIVQLPTTLAQATVCAPAVASDINDRLGWLPTTFSVLTFAVLCGLIIARQPHNRIGWLCGAIALLPSVVSLPYIALDCQARGLFTVPGLSYVLWLSTFTGLYLSLQFMLLPLWFPNGRFLSAGWRRFAFVVYGLFILSALLSALWPGRLLYFEMMTGEPYLANPFGLPFQPSPALARLAQAFLSLTLLGGLLIAQFSLLARWRRADGPTRQQIKLFAFFLVTIGTVFLLFELIGQLLYPNPDLFGLWGGWLYMALLVLLWAGYPIAVGVSVLKYRMYDVDVVIRKTLQYTAITALLSIIYFGSVFLLQRLFSNVTGQQSPLVLVVSTLLIAALFAPLRRRVQDAIDRRFYRKKYDAQQVLAQFARTARDETDLNALLAELERVIQETLQPEGVRVWVRPTVVIRQTTAIDNQPTTRPVSDGSGL